jgi:DNA repair protein RAD7
LTDFLASNNISALEIRSSYERRRQAAVDNAATETTETVEVAVEEEVRVETLAQEKRRKKREAAAVAKIKSGKAFQKKRKSLGDGEPEGDEDDLAWGIYEKSKPLPGQLENCEICDKRFTVTAYSKTGPEGGLLCTKCSKEQTVEKNKNDKAKKAEVNRGKRRKVQSDLLHGIVHNGARSLQELCIEVNIPQRMTWGSHLHFNSKWRTISMM